MAKCNCQGWQAVSICQLATIGFVLCLRSLNLQADVPADRGGGSSPVPLTVPPQPSSPETRGVSSSDSPPEKSFHSDQRTALNPLLIRDRRHRLLFHRGTIALQDGQSFEGLSHLQALLDASHDAFVWSTDSSEPRGARSDVIRWLHSSADNIREDYERLHGDTARDLLIRYRESEDVQLLVELIRRFGHTDSAREAALNQFLCTYDTGHVFQSREWATFLKADPFHWNRLSSPVRDLIVQHLSETTPPEVSFAQPHRPVLSGVTQSVDHVSLDHQPYENFAPYPVPIWTARFDSGVSLSGTESGDVQGRPASDTAQTIRESYEAWISHRTDSSLPVATVNEATVAGDVLVVRDFSHVRAMSIQTGSELWRYACRASLAAAAAQAIEQAGRGHQGGNLDFHSRFSGNSSLGRMTTDDRCVFLLDQSTTRSPFPDQLIALPLRENAKPGLRSVDIARSATPQWIRGAQSGVEHDDLSSVAFLGCPLTVDDRLYLLVESDQQISLVSLDSVTGRTVWKQPIALVEKPVTEDALRLRTSCTPLYHDGILCCPTEIGVVVGVEALTGRLQWVYDHMDDDQRSGSGRWAFAGGRNSDRSLLPNHMYLNHGRLLYLPSRSRDVHCLDAANGRLLWKQPRNDAHAIVGVTQSAVILLGDRECVALGLANGSICWQTSTPEPAGIGVVAGGRYFLPTFRGPCLSISLEDGRIEGRRHSRLVQRLSGQHHAPAGNLLVTDEMVIATTPVAVRVYPQAQLRLQQLTAAATRRSLSPAEQLLHAQLLMTIGEAESAGQVLQQLLTFDPPKDVRQNSEELLREVLYTQLEDTQNPYPLLDLLTGMARTDEDRLRLQIYRLTVSLQFCDASMLIETLDEFQKLPGGTSLSINGDEEYTVAAEQLFRDRLSILLEDRHPQLRESVAEYLTARMQEQLEFPDIAELERFVILFTDWPQTRPAQSLLAQKWIDAGRPQEAEQLLLSFHSVDRPNTDEPESRMLADLYLDKGLRHEDEQLRGSRTRPVASDPVWRHNLVSLGPGTDFRTLRLARSASLRTVDSVQTAMNSQGSASYPTPSLHVVEHRCTDSCALGERCGCQRAKSLRDTDGLRRVFVPQISGSLIVLDQGINKKCRTHSCLMLVDRDTGESRGGIDVPSAYWQLPRSTPADAGHIMIISSDSAHGVSLLEARTIWSVIPETSSRKNEKMRVGPTGADYCVLQSSQELHVVHPANGRTLWKRTHLPPGIGLQGNESIGILGDSHSLCVFDAEQASYALYQTQSGRKIREGKRTLAPDVNRRHRWPVGRHLVEVVTGTEGSRLCVWDSRSDNLNTDIPLTERLVAPLPGEEDFACVTADGRLQILHVQTGELLLDVSLRDSPAPRGKSLLEELGGSTSLTAFADRATFYINFTQDSDRAESNLTAPTDEFDVPHVRVRGKLIAFRRSDGRQLWDRSVPDACLPIQPEAVHSFLTLISRATDDHTRRIRGNSSTTTSLVVEVLDPLTGITRTQRGQLMRTRIVGYQCSPSSINNEFSGRFASQKAGVSVGPISNTYRSSPPEVPTVVASLIGMDSQIDIQTQAAVIDQPPRVAADEAESVNR